MLCWPNTRTVISFFCSTSCVSFVFPFMNSFCHFLPQLPHGLVKRRAVTPSGGSLLRTAHWLGWRVWFGGVGFWWSRLAFSSQFGHDICVLYVSTSGLCPSTVLPLITQMSSLWLGSICPGSTNIQEGDLLGAWFRDSSRLSRADLWSCDGQKKRLFFRGHNRCVVLSLNNSLYSVSSTSSGSAALHDDVTSSDPCQSGASLRVHDYEPDKPPEHAGQHG